MLTFLFNLLLGLSVLVLGLGVGALTLMKALFLVFVTLPLAHRLRRHKILTTPAPLIMDYANLAAAVILFAGALWAAEHWLGGYFLFFISGSLIITVVGGMGIRNPDNPALYVGSNRKYIDSRFTLEEGKDLPAERAWAMIQVQMEMQEYKKSK